MRILSALVLLAAFALPASAQTDLAWSYNIEPKSGHYDEFLAAMKEHTQWRKDHEDSWQWNVYEVINGPELSTFIVWSGGHTWTGFGEYALEGANRHFRDVVGPHIESMTSTIWSGDTTHVHLPDWSDDATLWNVVYYDIAEGEMDTFQKALGAYHDVITDSDYPAWYYFAYLANGGGDYEVMGAFPARGFADFENQDPSLESVMNDAYSEFGMESIGELWEKAVDHARSILVYRHVDLSTQ